MIKHLCAIALACTISFTVQAEKLTIDRLTGSPALSGPTVQGLKVSPDGTRITLLRGKEKSKSTLDLWEYDVKAKTFKLLVDSDVLLAGKTEVLSEAEKAARERNRSLTGKKGIVRYFWSKDSTKLLVPMAGDIYVMDVASKAVKRLTETPEYEIDIQFSSKGNYVSFVRDNDLYVVNVKTGKEKRLTKGASATVHNGVSEFVAQEELGRYTGYWWSPDETKVAYARVDTSPVPMKSFTEIKADGSMSTIEKRYPAAGTNNAIVDLGVVSVDGGRTKWIHKGKPQTEYLARVMWTRDSKSVSYQRLSRDQQVLDLLLSDANGRNKKTLLTEKSDVWINLHNMQYFLKKSDNFIWANERTGFRHLYLYDRDGNKLKDLTAGDWVVSGLARVDEDAGLVYFTGFKDSPLEQHLYSVSMADGPSSINRITRETGWHSVTAGQDLFIDNFSNPKQPPQVMIRNLKDGSTASAIVDNKLGKDHPYADYMHSEPKTTFGTIKAPDGSDLYYRMIKPAKMEKGKKYPAILAPYGGPHGQRVRKQWQVGINEYLARQGYVVLIVDNRGMWNRGVKFESHIKNAMGSVEVEDQTLAANWLGQHDFVDENRIGFHGWSYGGYMTLMAMFKHPDVFKVGVSVAPVTDWLLYDTAYTERYLSHPKATADAYSKSSVFPYVDNFKGKLLLIHGMADDNVFFENSVKLMSVMQKKGMDFDLMTYPGKRHGIRGDGGRAHVYMKLVDYFDRHLKAENK